MFFCASLAVVVFVFWISALISEITMCSNEEKQLAPGIKVGFGFLISLVYFSAAWVVMSVMQAWIFGIALLIMYAFGKINFFLLHPILLVNKFIKHYSKSFGIFLLGSLVFFLPLIISNNYGPFTEGGGDISIYSDTAKYSYDNELTAFGSSSKNLSEVMKNIKDSIISPLVSYKTQPFNYFLINPPAAENAAYRIIVNQGMNPFFYVPYVAYAFLNYQTHYPVYYGIQAFIYSCILIAIWCFFGQFGKRIAIASTILVMGSYGLMSIFYNMYSMQAISLAISTLIVAILSNIRLFSYAGFRTYGSAFIMTWLSYILYFSVLMPLIVGINFFTRKNKNNNNTLNKKIFFPEKIAIILFSFLCLFVLWIGSKKSFSLLFALISGSLDKSGHLYLGDSISFFSLHYLSFLFGFLSQQHFSPFVIENSLINIIIGIGVIFGFLVIILNALVMGKILFSSVTLNHRKKFYFTLYLFMILTVLIQIYLARTSLYTQAKGAQNVLIYFYIAMLLPLALTPLAIKEGLKLYKLQTLLWSTIILFTAFLLITRTFYTTKLAFSHDRSATMESSYFLEAEHIKRIDPKAYVLFEPRKSADLYLSIQPFYGYRMIPTRHLIVQSVDFINDYWTSKIISLSDLIPRNDLSNLWVFDSVCKERWPWFQTKYCTWKANKLNDQKEPKILLVGDNYERNFGERVISKNTKGVFSYITNGSALIFVPESREGINIDVVLQPRIDEHYKIMSIEIAERIQKGEFGKNVKLSLDGQNIRLQQKLFAKENSLILLAHFTGEYWINVKLNNHEIT